MKDPYVWYRDAVARDAIAKGMGLPAEMMRESKPRSATEIAMKLAHAEPRLKAIRQRIESHLRQTMMRFVHEQCFLYAIELTAEHHMQEIRRLSQRAIDRINVRLDEFVAREFGHCPRCRGELHTAFHSAAECVFGDTYVTSCLECDWIGEPH